MRNTAAEEEEVGRTAEESPRPKLNREQVVKTAVTLADADGIDALSMRRLAQVLGVVPMALYKHVAHKDELLDLMVDRVFEEIAFPVAEEWRTVLRERAVAMRAGLLRHPWALGLIESGTPGPANLGHHDAVLRCLRLQARLPFRAALHAYSLMDSYIYGYVHQENWMPVPSAVGVQSTFRRLTELHPGLAEEFPHMTELLTEVGRSGYDYGEEFDFGLELLLDGIERIRLREVGR
jgi:AcrR family transcriptional regulator